VKLTKEGNPNILSIPVYKGKPVKKGLLVDQIKIQTGGAGVFEIL
jgi:hypothetical protein